MSIPPEDIELLERRIEALGIEIIGLLIAMALAPFIALIFFAGGPSAAGVGIALGILVFLVGFGVAWYGSYLWKKFSHIQWTKQALREYDVEKSGTKKALLDQTKGAFDILSERGVSYVLNAGLRALNQKRGGRRTEAGWDFCPKCQTKMSGGSIFCSNCGARQAEQKG